MKTLRWFIPLAIFGVLLVFLFVGLNRDPREVPSPLIDKPAPAFSLARLDKPDEKLATDDLKGKVWLLNVWASWCVACRVEHPVLLDFSRRKEIPVYGLNYKDDPADGRSWLTKNGDPYTASIVDRDGRVGIDYGVYGVPETFLIDKDGIIRYKQIGPVTESALREKILPLARALQK